jgi:hypothetical protein
MKVGVVVRVGDGDAVGVLVFQPLLDGTVGVLVGLGGGRRVLVFVALGGGGAVGVLTVSW